MKEGLVKRGLIKITNKDFLKDTCKTRTDKTKGM